MGIIDGAARRGNEERWLRLETRRSDALLDQPPLTPPSDVILSRQTQFIHHGICIASLEFLHIVFISFLEFLDNKNYISFQPR
jgi:hypothetical protein